MFNSSTHNDYEIPHIHKCMAQFCRLKRTGCICIHWKMTAWGSGLVAALRTSRASSACCSAAASSMATLSPVASVGWSGSDSPFSALSPSPSPSTSPSISPAAASYSHAHAVLKAFVYTVQRTWGLEREEKEKLLIVHSTPSTSNMSTSKVDISSRSLCTT